MGNKFRFSDMIPNAWFYKLKDMSKSRKRNNGSHVVKSKATSSPTSQMSHPRCSRYFPNESTIIAGKLYNTPIQFHPHKEFEIPFTDSPRRSSSSSKRRSRRKTIYKPSPIVVTPSSFMSSSNHDFTRNWADQCQVRSPEYDVSSYIESSSSDEPDLHEYAYSESECDSFSVPDLLNGIASNCSCRVSSSTNDIIIDMTNDPFNVNSVKLDGFDAISGLAPMLTKPARFDDKVNIESIELRSSTELEMELDELQVDPSLYVKTSDEESCKARRRRKSRGIARKPSNSSAGIRLRVNSPKLASRKIQAYARRSVSSSTSSKASRRSAGSPDSFAVEKSSFDPQSDFKESMLEMIVENNIRASKDLEDLLACYLSLNSSEYHDLIIKAFEQIWFDIAQIRM